MKLYKAFTLAEIMIVLVIIGVLTAILLPVAIHSAPDENIMKFKKGNNTLGTVIRELVNSDEYYLNGDLGIKADGTLVNSKTYFCDTFSDVVSTKEKNCVDSNTGANGFFAEDWVLNGVHENIKKLADDECKNIAKDLKSYVTTLDNITYFESNPSVSFESLVFYNVWTKTGSSEELTEIANSALDGCNPNNKFYGNSRLCPKKSYFLYVYKIFCMDVDGIDKGEDPFGYGIRVDGKILTGARADEWLKKSIQKED